MMFCLSKQTSSKQIFLLLELRAPNKTNIIDDTKIINFLSGSIRDGWALTSRLLDMVRQRVNDSRLKIEWRHDKNENNTNETYGSSAYAFQNIGSRFSKFSHCYFRFCTVVLALFALCFSRWKRERERKCSPVRSPLARTCISAIRIWGKDVHSFRAFLLQYVGYRHVAREIVTNRTATCFTIRKNTSSSQNTTLLH